MKVDEAQQNEDLTPVKKRSEKSKPFKKETLSDDPYRQENERQRTEGDQIYDGANTDSAEDF